MFQILYQKAKESLNNKDYVTANTLFNKLIQTYPSKRRYKQGSADSHLGLAGFELLDFLVSLERLISDSFKSEELLNEAIIFVNKYFILEKDQKNHLNKALGIYSSFKEDSGAKSKEDRFKRGLIHVFFITQSIKELTDSFKNDEYELDDLDDLEKEYLKFITEKLSYIDSILFHFFNAYVNLKESFEQMETLVGEVDRAILDVFGTEYNEIKDVLDHMSFEKLAVLFIKYNPVLYKKILQYFLKTCDQKLALMKLKLLKEMIIKNYKLSKYQDKALEVLNVTIEYIKNHDEDVCNIPAL